MPSTRNPSEVVQPGPGRAPANTVPASALMFSVGVGGGDGAALQAHITDPVDAHMLSAIGQTGYAGNNWSVAAGTSAAALTELFAGVNARPVWVLDANPVAEADFAGPLAIDNAYSDPTFATVRPVLYLRPGAYTKTAAAIYSNLTLIGSSQADVTVTALGFQLGSNNRVENITLSGASNLTFDPGSYNVMRNVTLNFPGNIAIDGDYALLENVTSTTPQNIVVGLANNVTIRNYKNCQVELTSNARNCTVEHGEVTAVRSLVLPVLRVAGDSNTIHDIRVSGIASYNAAVFDFTAAAAQNVVSSLYVNNMATPAAGFNALSLLGDMNSIESFNVSNLGALVAASRVITVGGARNSLEGVTINGIPSANASATPALVTLDGTEMRLNGLTFLNIGTSAKILRSLVGITTGYGEFNSVYANELGTTLNLARVLDVTAPGVLGPLTFNDWSIYSSTGNDQIAYLSTVGNPLNLISFKDCCFAGAGNASYVLTMDQCFFVTMTNVSVIADSGKAALLTNMSGSLNRCSLIGGSTSPGVGNQLFGGYGASGLNLAITDTLFSLGSSNHNPSTKTSPCIFFGGTGVNPGGSPLAGQSGAAANITVFGTGVATVTGLTGMSADSVGKNLVITGAAAAGNNGTFKILSFISATSVTVANSLGSAPDGNNGSISWVEMSPHGSTSLSNCLVSNSGSLNLTSIVAFHLTGTASETRTKDSVYNLAIDLGEQTWTTTGSGQGVFGSFAGDSHPAVLEIFGDTTTTAVFDVIKVTGIQNTVALTDARHIVKAQNCTINNLLVDGPESLAVSGSFSDAVLLSNVHADGMDIFPTVGIRGTGAYVSALGGSVLKGGKIQNLVGITRGNALYLDASRASEFVISNTDAAVTVTGAMVGLLNSVLEDSTLSTDATTGDALVFLSTPGSVLQDCVLSRSVSSGINYITANASGTLSRCSVRGNQLLGVGGTGTALTLDDTTDCDVSDNKIAVTGFTGSAVFSITGTSTRNTYSNNHIAPTGSAAYSAFNIAADDNLITGNQMYLTGAANNITVTVSGEQNTLTDNMLRSSGNSVLTVSDQGNVIEGNSLVGVLTGTKIDVTAGNNNIIEGNSLVADVPVISLASSYNLVANNHLRAGGSISSLTGTTGNILKGNSLVGDTAVIALATGNTGNHSVEGNLLESASQVSSIIVQDGNGSCIQGNSLTGDDPTISIAGNYTQVAGNRLVGTGTGDALISVTANGDGSIVNGNALRNTGSGTAAKIATGSGCVGAVISNNVVNNGGSNAIDIVGTHSTVSGNLMLGSSGINIDGANTSVIGNIMNGNDIIVIDDWVTVTGNSMGGGDISIASAHVSVTGNNHATGSVLDAGATASTVMVMGGVDIGTVAAAFFEEAADNGGKYNTV